MAIVDYAGETADPDDAVALGERLLDRVAAVRDGDSPGLAPLALPLAADNGINHPGPYYLQVDGESFPVATMDSGLGKYVRDDLRQRGARGILRGDRGGRRLLPPPATGSGQQDGVHDYSYEAVLLRFSDETVAHECLAGLRIGSPTTPTTRTWSNSTRPYGREEAVAFTHQYDRANGVTYFYHPTCVRVGDVVARVDVIGIAPLAEAAGACGRGSGGMPGGRRLP